MNAASLFRKPRMLTTLLSAALLSSASALHADDATGFSRVQVKGDIHMLQGKGGNIGVLANRAGALLIDDDYQDMSAALKAALRQFGGPGAVNYLINTHWHGDHTGGNMMLGDFATIVAHDNVRARLLKRQEIKHFKMVSEPYPAHALPEITYSKTMTLHFGGETVELRHYPGGHTDGDTVIFFRNANVVHLGDHFFNGFFPFVDIDSGGSVIGMANNIAAILASINKDTRIIPGHGPLATKNDLKAFHDMLIGTTAEVEQARKAGKDLAAIRADGLSKRWKMWSNFIDTDAWIGFTYRSLEMAGR